MTEKEDHEVLAAEFVLGTLDADEREQAANLHATDAEFANAVKHWERRLGEFHVMIDPVEPSPDLWHRIKAQLPAPVQASETRPISAALVEPPLFASPRQDAESDAVVELRERFMRWRRIGIASGLVAASLAAFIVVKDVWPGGGRSRDAATTTGRYVAVLQQDATSPAFLVTVDLEHGALTVRRVAAERQAGKSYELWLVSNRFPAPRSLGVVGSEEFTVRQALAPYDRQTVREATFAVTLEPEGGSPTGSATGPILYLGKLFEAAPPGPGI